MQSMYSVLDEQLRAMRGPIEQCGLVYWMRKKLVLDELVNYHPDNFNNFRIKGSHAENSINYYTLLDAALVALFHTHLEPGDESPSDNDVATLVRLNRTRRYRGCYGIIYNVPSRTLVSYTNSGRILVRRTIS